MTSGWSAFGLAMILFCGTGIAHREIVSGSEFEGQNLQELTNRMSDHSVYLFLLDGKMKNLSLPLSFPDKVDFNHVLDAFYLALKLEGYTTIPSGFYIRIVEGPVSRERWQPDPRLLPRKFHPKAVRVLETGYVPAQEVFNQWRKLNEEEGSPFSGGQVIDASTVLVGGQQFIVDALESFLQSETLRRIESAEVLSRPENLVIYLRAWAKEQKMKVVHHGHPPFNTYNGTLNGWITSSAAANFREKRRDIETKMREVKPVTSSFSR